MILNDNIVLLTYNILYGHVEPDFFKPCDLNKYHTLNIVAGRKVKPVFPDNYMIMLNVIIKFTNSTACISSV